MINWDDFWWVDLTPEELDAFEADLAAESDWVAWGRQAEVLLTGQEP